MFFGLQNVFVFQLIMKHKLKNNYQVILGVQLQTETYDKHKDLDRLGSGKRTLYILNSCEFVYCGSHVKIKMIKYFLNKKHLTHKRLLGSKDKPFLRNYRS